MAIVGVAGLQRDPPKRISVVGDGALAVLGARRRLQQPGGVERRLDEHQA
jgi:hypothetical protein